MKLPVSHPLTVAMRTRPTNLNTNHTNCRDVCSADLGATFLFATLVLLPACIGLPLFVLLMFASFLFMPLLALRLFVAPSPTAHQQPLSKA